MNRDKLFHRFCGLTIFAVIILFFLGGLVRITGSGMGCPDWPKCFGAWVPPTSASQLPENYKAVYTEKRKNKVQRLTTFLVDIGMQKKADEINGTAWLLEPHDYSFGKAYTEYVNRLWGALTGIFAFLAMYFSFSYYKSSFWKMIYAIIGCFFIFYNGWLGSLVVDSNLFGGMVTIHFVVAFLSLFFFMISYYYGKASMAGPVNSKLHFVLVGFALVLGIIQLISGTFVRETADVLARLQTVVSSSNYEVLGSSFNLHRITAPILGIIMFAMWFQHRKNIDRKAISKFYLIGLLLIVIQVVSGSINVTHNFPGMTKLIHVTFGGILLTGLMFIFIQEYKARRVI